ncbi:invertase inhibitor [Canna indica]|uniref:Invertase inhibitor n=1 Tax=Canna indica TaxID=4628 RepID=A0AAQ3JRX8_9LILI|nr:invertase inhibitor [Canna indica]
MLRVAHVLLSFPLLFLLLLCRSSPTAATAQPDIVDETCNQTASDDPNVNYTLCVDSLRSVPRSKHADLRGLAIISLRLAKANATHAKSLAKALLKAEKATMSGYEKSCLETCRDLYGEAVSSLKSTVRMIKAERYVDAKVYASSAVDAPGGCEDGFQEGGIASPLAEENDYLFQLAVIALAITSRLG